jgi:hypothetical protein
MWGAEKNYRVCASAGSLSPTFREEYTALVPKYEPRAHLWGRRITEWRHALVRWPAVYTHTCAHASAYTERALWPARARQWRPEHRCSVWARAPGRQSYVGKRHSVTTVTALTHRRRFAHAHVHTHAHTRPHYYFGWESNFLLDSRMEYDIE